MATFQETDLEVVLVLVRAQGAPADGSQDRVMAQARTFLEDGSVQRVIRRDDVTELMGPVLLSKAGDLLTAAENRLRNTLDIPRPAEGG